MEAHLDKTQVLEAMQSEPHRFAWTEGGTSLVTYVAANSYEHYHEHAEQIREWIEKIQLEQ